MRGEMHPDAAWRGGLHGLGKLLEHDVGVLVLHAVEEAIHLHGHLSGYKRLAAAARRGRKC